MKNLILSLLVALMPFLISAQDGVGIGTPSPDPSAVLHVQSPSTFKGLLIPRYNTSQVPNIDNPANGLMIFDREKRVLAYYDSLYVNDDLSIGRWEFMRGLPVGSIIMWSGSSTNVPEGFALCDGSIVNGLQTPNLVSSFIRGSTNTSNDYTGALDVIPNLSTIDDNLVYNIDNSVFAVGSPCSAYEFIYTTTVTNSDCADPTQNNVFTVQRLGNVCDDNFPIPIPIGCTNSIDYCTSVVPNPNYYLLTPEDCLNDNILLYWDIAYIMRVD